MSARLAIGAIALALAARVSSAQTPRPLRLDDVLGPGPTLAAAAGTAPQGLAWIDDRTFLLPAAPGESGPPLRVDAVTGARAALWDPARLLAALQRAGVDRDAARHLSTEPPAAWAPGYGAMLLHARGDLFAYTIGRERLVRLTTSLDEEEEPAFSPDGRRVAYARGHDLYVAEVDGGGERRLTHDGSDRVLNGTLDWLYQEEVYGRGTFRAFWWSPDSRKVAFLRLDESRVPRFALVDEDSGRASDSPYPRPGEPNPGVRLGVVGVADDTPVWLDQRADDGERLIVDVAWRDSRSLTWQVQDREQTSLDLTACEIAPACAPRVLIHETTPAWVDPIGPPRFLRDGSFLWLSERSGARHLYHHGADGRLLGAVTSGEWHVDEVLSVDETRGIVTFTANERDPIGLDVYRVGLDGRGLTRLTVRAGWHAAVVNASGSLFLDTWSDLLTPPQVRLHRGDGADVRVVSAGTVPRLAEFQRVPIDHVTVPTRDGGVMDALLLRPPGFDPKRRYPVYEWVYGGPQIPEVRDQWLGLSGLWFQVLAQRGYVVWVLDNRSAGMRGGARAAWPVHRRLGERELADLEDGLAWLGAQPGVDAARVAISGWSYGGFLTAYALTHSTRWAAGVAAAPLTDWHHYDSIYTERLMGTPAHNAPGYRSTSVVEAADRLHGALLLLHGAADDNVHSSGTLALAGALEKAGRPFRMLLYPRQRHTFTDLDLYLHLHQASLEFLDEVLRPDAQR